MAETESGHGANLTGNNGTAVTSETLCALNYSAKDKDRNQAIVIRQALES